jgi:hypothetical protein
VREIGCPVTILHLTILPRLARLMVADSRRGCQSRCRQIKTMFSWDVKKCVIGNLIYMKLYILFVWLLNHQSAVFFFQNKPVINNQPEVLFSQNKPAPAISHQPNEQAALYI